MVNGLSQAASRFTSKHILASGVICCVGIAGTAGKTQAAGGITIENLSVSSGGTKTATLQLPSTAISSLQYFLTVTASTTNGIQLSAPTGFANEVTPYIFTSTLNGQTYANAFTTGQLIYNGAPGTTLQALTLTPVTMIAADHTTEFATGAANTYYLGYDAGPSVGSSSDYYAWIAVTVNQNTGTSFSVTFTYLSQDASPNMAMIAGSFADTPVPSVPEPASLSLFGASAIGLLARRRRL